jgi:ubiquitin carboxyl-terminal hydrolase 36/42
MLERDHEQGYVSHQEYLRRRRGVLKDDYRVDFRSQPVSGYDFPRRVQVEQDYRYADLSRKEDEESIRRRKWAEERRLAEADEFRNKQAKELSWRKQTEVEELRRKLAQAEEDERRHREAADAAIRMRIAEEEARRHAEEEARKRHAEEEVRRRHAEDEVRRRYAEEEFRRRQAEEEARRIQAEEEIRRIQAEEEFRRKQAEEEDMKRRQAALDEINKKAEAEAQAKQIAEEEEARKQKADEFIVRETQDDLGGNIGKNVQFSPKRICVVCQRPRKKRCSKCKSVYYCSRECQVQHWHEGHKYECHTLQACGSPSSSEGGARKLSDLLSPRSSRSDVGSEEIVASSLSPTISPASSHDPPAITNSAPVSPLSGSLLKTSSTVSADGRRLKPKKVLFSYDDFVELFDFDIRFTPCGLFNLGNSCFANAVLQCLTYTQPLVAYLLRGDHRRYCRINNWCFMCSLEEHAFKVKQNRPFSPVDIVSQLKNISRDFSYGKQEDAHEFMSYAIHLMQSICLSEAGGGNAVDDSTQETTLIHQIYSGRLQSQVRCVDCRHQSNIYETMMDLAVEIQGNVGSLEDALRQFTAPEILDGENKYKCDRCDAYVVAQKQITIHEAPNILNITLKRFKAGKYGKLNKHVAFSEVLDMAPYMSADGDRAPLYTLYGVVVHVDVDESNATNYGHYICLVKNPNGDWFRVDDAKVTQVDIYAVTSQQAYILLYKRSNCRPMDSTENPHPQASVVSHDWYAASSYSDHSQPQQFPLHMYPLTYSTRTDRTDTINVPIGISSGYG